MVYSYTAEVHMYNHAVRKYYAYSTYTTVKRAFVQYECLCLILMLSTTLHHTVSSGTLCAR